MKALVFEGAGTKSLLERPKPAIKTVISKRIEPKRLITHHFKLDQIMNAYDTFSRAAETGALKVMIET